MFKGKMRGTYDLKLDGLALKFDSADLEIDANGADVAFGICVVCKPKQKT